jgi:glucose/arabinose dehydrogenase
LTVPPNFSISVYARVPNARFMAAAPNGDVLVSRPGGGEVKIIRASSTGGDPTVSTFVSGLRNPHDIVFHTVASGTTYVYIAESNQINRYIYNYGDLTAHDRQIVVANLPDASSPELGGSYGHQLKNIALDLNSKLYISIASATNASPSDTTSNPVRCAIYQYNADGTSGRLFARGLRNAEGLAILPGSTELWVVVNNRDNIAYPFHNDWNGDGTDDYGKVMQSYVDNHPPEEFTRVRDGGNYGWPFANPNPDTASGFNNMPFDLDVQNNASGQNGAAASFDRITKGIQAHSAPLGVSFTGGTSFPAAYQPGAVVGLHGSWNSSIPVGYKVVYFPYDIATQTLGDQLNLVTGWTTGGTWGRPVDAIVDNQGNLLISDDSSGTIYKLTSTTTPPTPTPTPTPTPSPTTPSAPSNLTATAVSTAQINLSWNDNAANESGFKVEQSTDGTTFSQIATVSANVTSYSSTGLTRNRNYYYRVRSYNATGNSGYSNTIRERTLRK